MFKLIYKNLILAFFTFAVCSVGIGYIIINWAIMNGPIYNFLVPIIGDFLYALSMFVVLFMWGSPFIWLMTKITNNMLSKTKTIREESKYLHHYNIKHEPVFYYSNDGGYMTLTMFTLLGGIFGICMFIYILSLTTNGVLK